MPVPRMPAHLLIHDGHRGMLTVLEGMVRRNERAIRTHTAPRLDGQRLAYSPKPIWRDALVAGEDGVASAGTLAVWLAAQKRVEQNAPAVIAIVNGVPQVHVDGVGMFDPSVTFGRRRGEGVAISGIISGTGDEVWDDWIILGLDDDRATPVEEVSDAIARHNARMIVERKLPPLYYSGIRYYVEGLPERWLDYPQQLIEKRDDCEGLAATRAGELIVQGYDAHVELRRIDALHAGQGGANARGGGGRTFHAITRVNLPGGRKAYDDPSARLGMPVPTWYQQYADQRRARGLGL